MDGSSHSQPASNKVDAKKPNVGGLAEGRHREEAFAGRKPNNKWTGLDDPHAINFPLPNPDAIASQMFKGRKFQQKCMPACLAHVREL